jgi:hypothetical protein
MRGKIITGGKSLKEVSGGVEPAAVLFDVLNDDF